MFHSIRMRLQFWLAVILILVLSGFAVTMYQLQRTGQFKKIDDELERRVAMISGLLRGGGPPPHDRPPRFGKGPRPPGGESKFPPPPPRADHPPPPFVERPPGPPPFRGGGPGSFGPRDFLIPAEQATLFAPSDDGTFYFIVWRRDGTILKRSEAAPVDSPLPQRADRTDTRTRTRNRAGYREAYHYTELGDCVLAGISLAASQAALTRYAGWLTIAGLTVLLVGLGGGWWVTTRAIRPVETISAAARRISAGNLTERIDTADKESELGQLADVLNSTFARLEAAFSRQKQFTADAAHELRTPLAVIISEAQTTLARKRDAAEYRDAVNVCLDAAQQMKRLTESLLQLARFDEGRVEASLRRVDLAEICRAGVARIQPLANERKIFIDCKLTHAETLGEEELLSQLIGNLLSNAVYYNKNGGEVHVTVRAEPSHAVAEISDSGIGIPTEDLPHIFDRFYRVDKSRSAEEGRSGLGLAICKAIAETLGGSITVASQLDVGTTFTVSLPLALHETVSTLPSPAGR